MSSLEQDGVTHVRGRRAKTGPLGHTYEGPYKIEERVSNSCVKLRVGSYVDGRPRFEIQHWENLKPAVLEDNQAPAERPQPGRKPLNPRAEPFVPQEPKQTRAEQQVPQEPEQDDGELPSKDKSESSDNNIAQRPKRNKRRPMRFGGNCYD